MAAQKCGYVALYACRENLDCSRFMVACRYRGVRRNSRVSQEGRSLPVSLCRTFLRLTTLMMRRKQRFITHMGALDYAIARLGWWLPLRQIRKVMGPDCLKTLICMPNFGTLPARCGDIETWFGAFTPTDSADIINVFASILSAFSHTDLRANGLGV